MNPDELLAAGRKLADAILTQTRLCEFYFNNPEALATLDRLQAEFVKWLESAEELGIDVSAEFGDKLPLLKPYRKPVSLYDKPPRRWDELFTIGKLFDQQQKQKQPPQDIQPNVCGSLN